MAIKTYTEQLEDVQQAISDILVGGQRVGQRERARLDDLQRQERFLRRMVAREARGGLRVGQVVPRG